MWWRGWLKHCDTSRKVASSILNVVVGIFHLHNPSCYTMALGSTQSLTEMITRNISLGRNGGLHVSIVSESESLNLLEPSGSVIGL
jgi:hypothetical protein